MLIAVSGLKIPGGAPGERCPGGPGSAWVPAPQPRPWPPRPWPSRRPPGRARTPRPAPPCPAQAAAPAAARRVRGAGAADPAGDAGRPGRLPPGPSSPPHGPRGPVRSHAWLVTRGGSLGSRPVPAHPLQPAHREQRRPGLQHPEQQLHRPVAAREPPADPDGGGRRPRGPGAHRHDEATAPPGPPVTPAHLGRGHPQGGQLRHAAGRGHRGLQRQPPHAHRHRSRPRGRSRAATRPTSTWAAA